MSGGWGLSLRLAGRDVRRRPGRTALVVAAIGLPVGGLMAALMVVRTATETPEQARAAVYGQTDAIAGLGLEDVDHSTFDGMDPATDVEGVTAELQASLPDGSTVATVLTTVDGAVQPDGHLRFVDLSDEDLDDPLLDGRYDVLSGRAPTHEGEAAVPVDLAGDLDLGVGDELELLRRGTIDVTGIVAAADRSDSGRPIIVGGELTATPVPPLAALTTNIRSTLRWFVDLPADTVSPQDLPELAVGSWWPPFEQSDLVADRRTQMAISYSIAGVVLIVAGFVAVAAFAVGARRQLRTFGVLAAGGVPPSGLRRIAVLQGAVTGLVASVVGVGLAIGVGAAVVEERLPGWIDRAIGPLEVSVFDVVGSIVVGTVTATVAAAIPARTAARVPVLAALAGRRPLRSTPLRVPVAGLGLAAIGCVAVAMSGMFVGQSSRSWGMAVAGAAAVLVGGALMAPLVVGWLEPLAGRLRGSARLAARDLARHRVRTGAAAAAVLAPAAVAVFALTLATTREVDVQYLRTDQVVAQQFGTGAGPLPVSDDTRAMVREALPGAVEADLLRVSAPTAVHNALRVDWNGDVDDQAWRPEKTSTLAIATPELLDALAAPAEVADLVADDDTIVALTDVSDEVAIERWPGDGLDALAPDLVSRDDITVVPVDAAVELPRLLVSEGWATSRGLTTGGGDVVWRAPAPLTDAQQAAMRPDGAARDDASVRHALLGEPAPPPQPWLWYDDPATPKSTVAGAVAGGLLVFTLAVVAVTIALTRAESRDENALLAAIGVPPGTQRGVAGWQALLVPAVGVAIGAALGVAGAWSTLQSDPYWGDAPLVLPWVGLGLLAAIPLVSGALTRGVAVFAWRRRHRSGPAFAWD